MVLSGQHPEEEQRLFTASMHCLATRLRTDYADGADICLPDCNCGGNCVLERIGEQLQAGEGGGRPPDYWVRE